MKINKNQLIYVVDDDLALNTLICKNLQKVGFKKTQGITSGEELLKKIKKEDNVIIIQDFNLAGINGIETMQKVKDICPKADFIFLSGQSSIEVAVDAIRLGAFDYIVKDTFAKENVLTKITNLLKIKTLSNDKKIYRTSLIVFAIFVLISYITLLILFSR